MMQQRNNMLGFFLLSATALIWGGSFVAQKLGMDHIGPFSFTFFSDLLAGTFLLSLAAFRSIAKGERFSWPRTDIIGGIGFRAAGWGNAFRHVRHCVWRPDMCGGAFHVQA